MYFRDYMTQASYCYDICKEIDGTTAIMKLTLAAGTTATAVFDEVNLDRRAFVRAGGLMPPIDRHGRDRFIAACLEFNRNALSILDVGMMPNPDDERIFCPTWFVPKIDQDETSWNNCMSLFESLVSECKFRLTRTIEEWVNYRH